MSNREQSSGASLAPEGETPAYTYEELADTETDTMFEPFSESDVPGGYCAAVEWQQDA